MTRASLRSYALHAALASLPLLLAVAWIWWSVGEGPDAAAAMRLHRYEHPELRAAMRLLSDWGNALFYPVYAGMLWLGRKRRDAGLVRLALAYIVMQLAVSLVVVRFFKIFAGRPRPDVDGLARPFALDSAHNAFPSGHTTEITGACMPLALTLRRVSLSLGLGVFAALVGVSRIYLGMHHPSDVLAGWALGAVAGMLAAFLATSTIFLPRLSRRIAGL